jgi:hypothetical protein
MQHEQVARTFVIDFSRPFDSEYTEETFLSVYHPNVEWFDYAFHICRVGHEAVLGLRTSFLHCNQPFRSEPKVSYTSINIHFSRITVYKLRVQAIISTPDGAVAEQLWIGRCANDIVRPDGQVAVKGTGKDFKAHVCMVLKIDEDGLITRIDEYYNRAWDEGIIDEQYKVIKGGYSKKL